MRSFTDLEQDALDRGLAMIHHGRVVPVMKGGSDDDLGDTDTGDDTPADAAPADADQGDVQSEPPAPAAAAIDWNDPDIARQIDERASHQARQTFDQIVAEAQANQPRQGFDFAGIDPFADDFGNQLAEGLRSIVNDAVAPLMPVVESTQQREAQEWTDQQLQRLNVPSDDRDAVLYLAGGLHSAAEAAGQRVDGAQILQYAVEQLKTRDERVAAAAIAKHQADTTARAGAGREPAAAGGAVNVEAAAGSLVEAARRFSERKQLTA
jgi:hypothetical protein